MTTTPRAIARGVASFRLLAGLGKLTNTDEHGWVGMWSLAG